MRQRVEGAGGEGGREEGREKEGKREGERERESTGVLVWRLFYVCGHADIWGASYVGG